MAFTERYVTTSGSSGNGGTNDTTDAWDFKTGWQAVGAGIRLNVKAGTYNLNLGGSITTLNTGSMASPCHIRGYTSTIGDLTYSRDSNGDLVTTGMPIINLTAADRLVTGYCVILEGLSVIGSRSNELMNLGGYTYVYNVRSENTYNLGFSSSSAFSCGDFSISLIGCDAIKSGTDTAYGVILNTGGVMAACKVKGGAGVGVYTASGYFSIIDCVIHNCTIGIQVGSMSFANNPCIVNNTIYNCSTTAIDMPNSGNMAYACSVFVNNHVTDCGRFINNNYGSVCANANVRNRTRDNTNANTQVGDWPVTNGMTIDNGTASSDYVDTSNNNFFLRPTAVGRATGLLPYRDIGGMQAPSSSNSVF